MHGNSYPQTRTTLRTKEIYFFGTKSTIANNLHFSRYSNSFSHKNQRRSRRIDWQFPTYTRTSAPPTSIETENVRRITFLKFRSTNRIVEQSASFIDWGEAYSGFFQIPLNSTTKSLGRTKSKTPKHGSTKWANTSQKEAHTKIKKNTIF